MESFITILNANQLLLSLSLLLFILLLFSYAVWLKMKLDKLTKRFTDCFGRRLLDEDYSLEQILKVTLDETKQTSAKVSALNDKCDIMERKLKYCLQKKSLIRYNPFEDMGGNLSYAVALLDEENTGVVLNGIHSRTGSHTYAKPIEKSKSIYALSHEEISAISEAIAQYKG